LSLQCILYAFVYMCGGGPIVNLHLHGQCNVLAAVMVIYRSRFLRCSAAHEFQKGRGRVTWIILSSCRRLFTYPVISARGDLWPALQKLPSVLYIYYAPRNLNILRDVLTLHRRWRRYVNSNGYTHIIRLASPCTYISL